MNGQSLPRKIVLAPLGSDGDVFPMLSFAKRLRERGHDVLFCSAPPAKEHVLRGGYKFIQSGLDLRAWTKGRNLAGGSLRERRRDIAFMQQDVRAQFPALVEAAKGAYAIFSGGYNYAAASIAESYRIPHLHIFHVPNVYPTSDYPCMNVPWQRMPKIFNRVSWKLNQFFQNSIFRKILNEERQELGLAPLYDVWKGFTENSIVTLPPVMHQVPEECGHPQTSYWFPEFNEELPAELLRFIQAGSKPFYFGLGSMPSSDKREVFEIIKNVCRRLQIRAILSRGWAEFESSGDPDVFLVGPVSHAQLFPHLDLVIHHGGAGTVMSAGRAGVAQIIVPHIFDQFYWGERVQALGLGPSPIPRTKLNALTLGNRIEDFLANPDYRKNARELKKTGGFSDGLDDFFRPDFLKKLGLAL